MKEVLPEEFKLWLMLQYIGCPIIYVSIICLEKSKLSFKVIIKYHLTKIMRLSS